MAQAGVYAPEVVIDADVVVRVNGVVREHVSMDWAGDTTGGLPGQVVSAGTGMRSRTGSIVWAPQDPVEVEPAHPLRREEGWPPREGDEVVIDATVDTGQGPHLFRRFTGRLGRTTGSLTDGTLASKVTDTLADRLGSLVSIPPLVYYGTTDPSAWGVVYRAFEAAGLAHLPDIDADTVVHFPLQGEISVTRGALKSRGSTSSDGTYWLWQAQVKVTPEGSPNRSGVGGKDVLVVARGSRLWGSWAQVEFGPGRFVRLNVDRGLDTAPGLVLTVDGSRVWTGAWTGGGIPVLAFQIEAGGIRVWTDRGSSSLVVSTVLSRTEPVLAASGEVSGLSVRYLSTGADPARMVADMTPWPVRWRPSTLATTQLEATRGIENETARSVVDQWSESTLASVWMDEVGAVVARPRDNFINAASSRELRIDERVFSGSWSVGDDSVRSSVIVTGEQGAVERPHVEKYRALVYQEGNARTFDTAETVERFIEAPGDTEWGPIDLTASRWTSSGSTSGILPASGTWIHAVVIYDGGGGPEDRWAWGNVPSPSTYSITIERLGQRTLKLTEQVAPGSGVDAVYLKSPEKKDAQEAGWIASPFRNVASPVIRGFWISTWTDFSVAGVLRGPSWAPVFEHAAGWWLHPVDAQKLADTLAAELVEPMVTLSGVTVLWDPRRQIGDVETWIATGSDGSESWRADVLVTGYSESWDGNVPSQSVDVRVISMVDLRDGKTYADLHRAYGTYSQLEAYQPTYQQVYDSLPEHF